RVDRNGVEDGREGQEEPRQEAQESSNTGQSQGIGVSVREVFKPQALRIVVSLLPALACVFAEFL
ncbi:unnamed protein product, partial [Polarella glacialis]